MNRCKDADLRLWGLEGTQEALVQELELHFIKGLPCTHSNKQALKIASKGVRVGTQISAESNFIYFFFKRETNNIILKGFSLLANIYIISLFPFPLLS